MVKVFCDRCGTEVENLDALLQFSIDVTEQPNRSAWSWRAEICQDCFTLMKEEISRVAQPPDDKKKNPKK
ncbi:MAG: hypothetical protein AB7G75_06810 [Candidatus Binatia bacterium]